MTVETSRAFPKCRMEAAPSVSFHDRAPDLMAEEDLQSNQLEAEESVSRLQASHWQAPRDTKEGLPAGKADRADLSYELPTERAEVPFGDPAERTQKGETSYGLENSTAYGQLTLCFTRLLSLQSSVQQCTNSNQVFPCMWAHTFASPELPRVRTCKGDHVPAELSSSGSAASVLLCRMRSLFPSNTALPSSGLG